MNKLVKQMGVQSGFIWLLVFAPMIAFLIITPAGAQAQTPAAINCANMRVLVRIKAPVAWMNHEDVYHANLPNSDNPGFSNCQYSSGPSYSQHTMSQTGQMQIYLIGYEGNVAVISETIIPLDSSGHWAYCITRDSSNQRVFVALTNGVCAQPNSSGSSQLPRTSGLNLPRGTAAEIGPIPKPTRSGPIGEIATPVQVLPKIVIPPPPVVCGMNVEVYYGPFPATYGPYNTLVSTTGCNFTFSNVKPGIYGALGLLKPTSGPVNPSTVRYTTIDKFTVTSNGIMKGAVTKNATTGVWTMKQVP